MPKPTIETYLSKNEVTFKLISNYMTFYPEKYGEDTMVQEEVVEQALRFGNEAKSLWVKL